MTTLADRDERLRPAFIAKSYPPVLGGMEAVSFHLARELRAIGETEVYANPRGAIAFPLFAPVSTLKAAARVRSGRVNLVHLSDALMAPSATA